MPNLKILPILVLILATLACNTLGGAGPTATPVAPTLTPTGLPGGEATATPPSTAAATPTPAAGEASATPGASATPVPGLPPEVILILEPGFASSVASPVHVSGEADPTFEQALVIEIADENGAVLATAPVQIAADIGERGPFEADIAFSVDHDQAGRISVYATSARDGGLTHLSSIEVTLRASGPASVNPPRATEEALAIFEPAFLATISGGTVHIRGFSAPVFENQLVVAICGEGGSGAPEPLCGTADNVIGTGLAMVDAPDIGQPGPFGTDVAYTVSASTRGRIAVYATSARDGGLLHVGTVEVTLEP